MTKERLEQILELLKKYSGPEFSDKINRSGKEDELSLVAEGLQLLVKELKSERKRTETLELKLNRLSGLKSGTLLAPAPAREKLSQEKLSLFASIVNLSDDAIISKNLDGNITSWNNAAEKILGYRAEEIIGRPISVLVPPHLQEEESNILALIRGGSLVRHYETERVRKDGSVIEVSLTISPVKDLQGNITGASKILRDISEKRKSEERLSLLASIINSSDDAIICKNLEGIIISWNPGAEKVFGYSAEEMTGRHVSVLIPPQFMDEENMILQKIKNGELVDHYETQRIRKDGKLIDVSLTISPVRDRSGKITGASKILRDITDKCRAEIQLRTSEQEYRSLIEQATDGIFISSQDGKYCDVNLSACKMLGYTREEILERSVNEIVVPEDLKNNPIDFEGLKAGKVFLTTRQMRRKDGSTIYVESNAKMLPNGKLLGMVRDITERKVAERKEKEHLKDLEEMMFITSHKVRQPVAHILGVSHLLDGFAYSEAELKKIAAIMKDSAVILDNFTRELADFIYEQGMKAKENRKEE